MKIEENKYEKTLEQSDMPVINNSIPTEFEEDVLQRLKRLALLEEKIRWIPIKEKIPPENIDLEFKTLCNGYVNICKIQELEGKLCLMEDLGYGLLSDTKYTHWRIII